jgi:hypothetical protein
MFSERFNLHSKHSVSWVETIIIIVIIITITVIYFKDQAQWSVPHLVGDSVYSEICGLHGGEASR